MPQRIQRKRTKGWRKPENAVIVDRGSRWGNPYVAMAMEWNSLPQPTPAGFVVFYHDEICSTLFSTKREATEKAVELYRIRLLEYMVEHPDFIVPLRGKDLACWCREEGACHADVLLELANA